MCRDVHDRGGRRNRCRNPTERRRSGIPPTMATSRATLVGGGLVGRGVLPLSRPSRRESFIREPGGRVLYLSPDEEEAVRAALPVELHPLFIVSINTGLRWSEQAALEWRDV